MPQITELLRRSALPQEVTHRMLAERPLDLPYRPCVGIMLINREGLVWVGRRRPKWAEYGSGHIWQMPQGGITPGEGERAAALRELEEEGIVERTVVPATPIRVEYALTKKGRALASAINAITDWAHKWVPLEQPTAKKPRPRRA